MSVRESKRSLLALVLVLFAAAADAAVVEPARLANELRPYLDCLRGAREAFSIEGRIELPIDGKPQTVRLFLQRRDDQSFDLELKHEKYHLVIERRADQTVMLLPAHRVAFEGHGSVSEAHQLAPANLLSRLISARSRVASFAPMLDTEPQVLAVLLANLLQLSFDPQAGMYHSTDGSSDRVRFQFKSNAGSRSGDSQLILQVGDEVTVELGQGPMKAAGPEIPGRDEFRVVAIPRDELERVVVRGVRRALEILQPGPQLTSPRRQNRRVEHGELRWIDGQRVVLLQGTPEQIGRAHAELLVEESQACIDSVLNTFGLAQTIQSGQWFRLELDRAYSRLMPHIPQDHLRETAALARTLGHDEALVQALNVFPELFHCSGFAVFDSATVGGKLYHGRVLDYMTTIGLQDAATTFVIAVDGKIPFVNVGYAGFIGSVSGMNAERISLGEMGGRGEGQWDGAPMATLMRRALEECSSLQEVKDLWTNSPRTCEYYYVFADGETNDAVGVAATPEKIEFVEPGAAHPLLGDGIPDAVVLSAGSRLEKLRERVKQRHGAIDADAGMWLMSRPVAMQSNLHNVLFVPADGVLYVANADHRQPAAERPYVRLSLSEIMSWKVTPGQTEPRTGP